MTLKTDRRVAVNQMLIFQLLNRKVKLLNRKVIKMWRYKLLLHFFFLWQVHTRSYQILSPFVSYQILSYHISSYFYRNFFLNSTFILVIFFFSLCFLSCTLSVTRYYLCINNNKIICLFMHYMFSKNILVIHITDLDSK